MEKRAKHEAKRNAELAATKVKNSLQANRGSVRSQSSSKTSNTNFDKVKSSSISARGLNAHLSVKSGIKKESQDKTSTSLSQDRLEVPTMNSRKDNLTTVNLEQVEENRLDS